jgi:hypothetical protein
MRGTSTHTHTAYLISSRGTNQTHALFLAPFFVAFLSAFRQEELENTKQIFHKISCQKLFTKQFEANDKISHVALTSFFLCHRVLGSFSVRGVQKQHTKFPPKTFSPGNILASRVDIQPEEPTTSRSVHFLLSAPCYNMMPGYFGASQPTPQLLSPSEGHVTAVSIGHGTHQQADRRTTGR